MKGADPSGAGVGYVPPYLPEFYDEALTETGSPRPPYAGLMGELAEADLGAIAERTREGLDRRGVSFGTAEGGPAPFHVDPVPRVLEAAEWHGLVLGMRQRARAVNAFIADAYGDRRIVEAGVLPARVIEGAEGFEPGLMGVEIHGRHAPVVGFDLVRGADGRFRALEENARTPSGLAYAAAARVAVDEALGFDPAEARLAVAPAFEALRRVIRGAAPEGGGDPSAALLSDGPLSAAWFEHRTLAAQMRIPLVSPGQLAVRRGRLYAHGPGRPTELQVVYLRTGEDRFSDETGTATWLGEAMLEPLRRGHLGIVNVPGAGIGDDKLTHGHVSEMVRFYLGQEPQLPAVRDYDLEDADVLEEVLGQLGDLVVKPRGGYGGAGVIICRDGTREELEAVAGEITTAPERFVAQETVTLSSHPTVFGAALEPRHIDLRAFAIGDTIAPGALTRVALQKGSLVVNSSRQGGAKDTWVLA
ncbi:MAG TPA: circularly permuted type 2 ATP-grasp protein [Solirubrobacterales bacterium]|jgi:carboxylate-amine ligase|nr:circularly permuted type 2 ATP-grasp protein [Solirubrobacterales bacterium]